MPKGIYANYRDERADQYKIKLTYFQGRGRAEHIRLLFAAGGIKYEDHTIEGSEWPKLKPETPLGTLPMIEVDGKCICGGPAIGRFVAKIADLAGDNFLMQCQVDSFVDISLELREIILACMQGVSKTPDKAEELTKTMTEKATPILATLEKRLGSCDYFVGNKLSYADIQFAASVEHQILTMKNAKFLDDYPNLNNLYKRVMTETPSIVNYIKSRPDYSF